MRRFTEFTSKDSLRSSVRVFEVRPRSAGALVARHLLFAARECDPYPIFGV